MFYNFSSRPTAPFSRFVCAMDIVVIRDDRPDTTTDDISAYTNFVCVCGGGQLRGSFLCRLWLDLGVF